LAWREGALFTYLTKAHIGYHKADVGENFIRDIRDFGNRLLPDNAPEVKGGKSHGTCLYLGSLHGAKIFDTYGARKLSPK
jgi:hypothetical protein